MPPTAQITTPVQALHRGDKMTFTATIHDPDQSSDSLKVDWYVGTDGDCDKAMAGTAASCGTQRNDQCLFTPNTPGSICVAVRVTDRYGASAVASRVFTVENRAPTAAIVQTSPAPTTAPLPLLSNLAFSAADSTDPDPNDTEGLTFTWTVTQPDKTTVSLGTCASPDTPDMCSFTASMPGTYHVQVTVTDPCQASNSASVDVVIAQDQPPCITGTTPRSLQTLAFSDQTESFVVDSVADDVDPYPESTSGTFTWLYRIGTTGDFQRWLMLANSNRLAVGPALLAQAVGDVIQIRVEYQDSRGHSLSSCDQDADRCELIPGCAQWVTWTVTVFQ
jgi:REJ domain